MPHSNPFATTKCSIARPSLRRERRRLLSPCCPWLELSELRCAKLCAAVSAPRPSQCRTSVSGGDVPAGHRKYTKVSDSRLPLQLSFHVVNYIAVTITVLFGRPPIARPASGKRRCWELCAGDRIDAIPCVISSIFSTNTCTTRGSKCLPAPSSKLRGPGPWKRLFIGTPAA